MARSLNKALLIGNLGADPEVRTTANGARVAQLSLATNRSWTDAQGETQERTEWHRVVVWDRLVEVVEQYLHRGDRVYVEGEIQYRSYEDSEGVTRHVTEVRARELVMLGGQGEEAAAAPTAPEARGRTRERRRAPAAAGAQVEEDLPF